MKRILGTLFVFFILPTTIMASQSLESAAINIENSLSFQTTIIINNKEIEWEFVNPDEYEWEKGNTVLKGEMAKSKVEGLYKQLKITKDANVNHLVEVMKNNGYQEIDKLDVRWVNQDGKLYTWIWNKPE